jgi:amino acid adenylation domain-containing protein
LIFITRTGWPDAVKGKKGENLMVSRDLTREITVASGQYVKEENYWLDKLSGELVKSYFPYDFNPDKDKQTRAEAAFDTVKFGIEGELFSKLTALSSGAEKVLHLVLTAGVILLLNKYSYDAGDDIIVGVPIYTQDIEGDFINTVLALRIQLEGGITFKELLIQVKQVFIAANENQNYPIETLMYLLNIPYSPGGDFPLFDVAIWVQGLHARTYLNQVRLNTIFSFNRSDEGLAGELEYNPLLYKKTTIERISGLLKQLLQAVVSDINRPLSAVPLTSGRERQQLLFEFNRTDAHYPRDKTIHRLFEQQVEKAPGNTAVIYNGRKLTYRELNNKVNRLAHLLREKGIKADTIVGIMVERSMEMIVGIFAILKAGGAYLPIDAETPVQRIAMMLEDARAPMLLTTTREMKGKSWSVLKGIPRVRSRPHLTGRRPQITDLDSLPIPDRSLVSYDKYRSYIGFGRVKNCISIQGTRGCPYKCAYCHKIWPKKHVFRSAENLVEEVKLYYDMGVRRFAVIDDIFNVNVKNSSRFYELIIKNGLDVHFFFPTGIRGDILTEDYIDLMIEAGVIDFAVALETASPRLQKLIGKNLDIEKLHRNIEYICKKYPRVILELFTMHGFPSETEEEAVATLEFIKSRKWLHFPYINILRIYLNTDMEKLAIAHGISRQSIIEADTLSQHDFADTLPFDRSFTKKYQSEFLNEYFLNRERLLHVLPHQMKVFTRDELAQRYDSYLPVDIHRFEDFLEFAGIKEEELDIKQEDVLDEKSIEVPNLDEKIKSHFPVKAPVPDAPRLLLLDLSQFFKAESSHMLYDVHEPPLGLMTLMTYLKREFAGKINGKVAKSRIDFDTYEELREILEVFKPDLIGIRTLTFYKEFFHEAVAMIRHWGIDVPIIAGGPYATSDYATILQDRNVDLVVMGEGESTFTELVNAILENGGKLPGEDVLKEIKGMAFIPSVPGIPGWEVSFSREVLLLDTFPGRFGEDDNKEGPAENPGHINCPGDLAYVIYTSGSTGRPKGVMIRHRSLVNRLNWMQKAYPIAEADVILHKTPFIFDVSVWEIFWWAIRGSSVCLLGAGEERNPEAIIEAVETKRVTTMHFVPSMLNAFCGYVDVDGSENVKRLSSLRQVFSSGEALGPHLVETFYRLVNAGGSSRTRLINLYGPTEATVDVSYFDCPPQGKPGVVPIGKPIDNIRLYVVNRDFQVQPPGLAGELCISGDGLARGYLNHPELTAEKFINYRSYRSYRSYRLHFSKTLYRTGDLACWLPDGNIEFLGRIDHQVKIRGLRIELEEIESLLHKHGDIDEAVVSAKEDKYGDLILCAYIVSGKEIVTSELRDYLARELPDYYIPSYFMQIEEIPLTPSGKVDRKGLPEIEIARDEYITPRDRLEEKLAEIWQEVLGLEQVSVRDNLFNIGGDSIKTIKLVSVINTQLQTNLKIVDVYANETIEKLARRMEQETPSGRSEELEVLKEIEELKNRVLDRDKLPGAQNVEDIYPLSDIESGMLFYSFRDREHALYHDQMVLQMKYHGFDPGVFKRALALMVEKHSILRTCFNLEDFGESIHMVYKNVELNNLGYHDISGMEKAQQEKYLREFLEKDRQYPFKLTGPLWRMNIFACGPDIIVIVWVVHHAVMDGWSNALFLTELNNTYLKLKSDPGFVPQELKNTYKAFVIEQIIEKRKKKVWDYWRNELAGYKRLDFPGMGKRNDENGSKNRETYVYNLGSPLAQGLKEVAGRYDTSIKNLCFGAYVYMLSMLSYENDMVVGLVTNSRPLCEDGDKLVGCFLNTIPFRIKISGNITWLRYIDVIDKKLLEIKEFERLPLFEIVRIIGEKPEARNPIFDTLFNFIDFYAFQQVEADNNHHYAVEEALAVTGYTNTNTHFDFSVDTTFGRFLLSLAYSPAAVSGRLVRQVCRYFERILNRMIFSVEEIASKVRLIEEKERQEILYDFNNTGAGYPVDQTIHELFESQAVKTPGNIALVEKDMSSRSTGNDIPVETGRTVHYRQLNENANRLARILRNNGVKSDTIVSLVVEPSIEMVTGILAILKAGGAYLPIDPDYPPERVTHMLNDSGAHVLLIGKELIDEVEFAGKIIDLTDNEIDGQPIGNLPSLNMPSDLAYIIYTSGTTGKSKGTMIEHKNVVRLMTNDNFLFDFNSDDVWTMFHSYCFDFSVWEMYGALLYGGKLVIIPKMAAKDTGRYLEIIQEEGVTVLNQTPSAFYRLIEEDVPGQGKSLNLKYVIFGGEALSPGKLAQWKDRYPRTKLINMFGITETTVHVTFKEITAGEIAGNISNIGRPLPTLSTYVMDNHMELLPLGVAGELCVGGDGLGRGYLNKPGLSHLKFVKDPYRPGRKIYRSGDLVRMSDNGEMEYLGRIDRQVKIRGYRIEPGEIQYRLTAIDYIREAVVTAMERREGDKYLCAYVVSDKDFEPPELKNKLSDTLPDYMIPSYFVRLEKIPLTPNGKIDENALPEPGVKPGDDYTAPRNEIEEKLAVIWADLLNIEKGVIGIDADFFDLGGHSLKATNLVVRIHKELEAKLRLVEIFQNPSIRQLARLIEQSGEDKHVSIEAAEEREYYVLSSNQKRLYFVQRMDPGSTSYNVPMVELFEVELHKERLEATFNKLIRRHESFMTSFENIEEEPFQRIHVPGEVEFRIEYHDLTWGGGRSSSPLPETIDRETREIINGFVRPFDLSCAPLLRVGLIHGGKNRNILMVDMHHIITDGISMRVTIEDFRVLYADKELPELPLQYKDYSHWRHSEGYRDVVERQENYWLQVLEGRLPVLDLPTDYMRPPVQNFEGDCLKFEIGDAGTGALNKLAKSRGTTLYTVLLTILYTLLARISGQEDIVVGSYTSGRNYTDLDRIVGMFVNTLALRNYPKLEKTFIEFLEEVKENTLNAFENQDYPFEELVETLGENKRKDRNPIFDVMFGLQNFSENLIPGTETAVPGKQDVYESENKVAHFDITLVGVEIGVKLYFILEYCSKLFKKETIERMIKGYLRIVDIVADNSDIKIKDIELQNELIPVDRVSINVEFNI